MSWFGNNTFKQTILDEIESRQEQYNMSRADAISETCQVIAHLADRGVMEREQIEKIREEVKREILADLKQKLG
jgi:hypothetical protein